MATAKTDSNNEDVPVVTYPKVTVGFERSVQIRDFEPCKASVFIPQEIAGTWDENGLFVAAENAITDAVAAAFFEAKVAVLKQLNLQYEVVDGVVLELVDKVLGPTDVVGTTPTAGKPRGGGSKSAPQGESKDDLWSALIANPTKWFDNRESKTNPKAPDFKRKGFGNQPGLWLDGKDTPDFAKEHFAA